MLKRKDTIGIPDAALDKHIAILGKTGSGKTNTAKVTVERLLDRGERVCIVDPTSAWWGLRVMADGKTPGYEVVVFGGKHGDLPLSGAHGSTVADVIGKSSTPAILDTRLLTVSDRTRFFTEFAETLVRTNQGPLTLVIDEAHLFMPQAGARSGGQAPAMLHAGNNLVSLGRSLGLRIILISQRPAKLHKDGLTQIETLVAMRLIAPHDRNAINDWIKEWADPEEGKNLISGLPSMPTGEAVVWSPELGLLEKMQFPLARTFDSSKAPTKAETDELVLAPIDLESLEGKLQEAAEEAKANDPRHLKSEIARLNKALQDAQAQKPEADPQAIEDATDRGWEQGRKVGYQDGWEECRSKIENALHPDIEKAKTAAIESYDALKYIPSLIEALARPTAPRTAPKAAPPPTPQRKTSPPATPKPVADRPGNSPSPSVDGLDRPQARVLEAVARWSAIGFEAPTRTQVAFLAGYSPKGGGFNNILGKLRSHGLADYPSNGTVGLTDAGKQAMNGVTTMTAEDLIDGVRSVLNQPQQTVLAAIMGYWPEQAPREQIAEASGYSVAGGGFNNILGRLRSFGLIDYPSKGVVRAQDWLFP